jgi:hypothetical protein
MTCPVGPGEQTWMAVSHLPAHAKYPVAVPEVRFAISKPPEGLMLKEKVRPETVAPAAVLAVTVTLVTLPDSRAVAPKVRVTELTIWADLVFPQPAKANKHNIREPVLIRGNNLPMNPRILPAPLSRAGGLGRSQNFQSRG